MVKTTWRSPQIFEEELNDTTMLDAFRPIEGTNLTTAVYYATLSIIQPLVSGWPAGSNLTVAN
jgi:hypothetical protein